MHVEEQYHHNKTGMDLLWAHAVYVCIVYVFQTGFLLILKREVENADYSIHVWPLLTAYSMHVTWNTGEYWPQAEHECWKLISLSDS